MASMLLGVAHSHRPPIFSGRLEKAKKATRKAQEDYIGFTNIRSLRRVHGHLPRLECPVLLFRCLGREKII